MSSGPNQVGSPHDKANAEFMLQKFRDWGWDAQIETFNVLYPTPKHESLQLIAPRKFTARLQEPPIAGDATSGGARRSCRPTTSMAPTGMSAASWCTSITACRMTTRSSSGAGSACRARS